MREGSPGASRYSGCASSAKHREARARAAVLEALCPGHVAGQAVAKRLVDRHGHQLAGRVVTFGRDQMNDLVSLAAPSEAPVSPGEGPSTRTCTSWPTSDSEVRLLLRLDEGKQAREAIVFHLFGDLIAELERRRIRPRRVLERKGGNEADAPHQLERLFEVFLGFPREADDEIGRKASGLAWPASARRSARCIPRPCNAVPSAEAGDRNPIAPAGARAREAPSSSACAATSSAVMCRG